MKNERVPGVDKRLVLIQPNELGHHETSIVENPSLAIDTLKIAPDMVNQRIRVLTRRDKVGRTGIFLNKELDTEDNFEQKLDELAQKNPLIRRRLNM
jgi:predicted nucleotidyltransferase